MNVYEYHVKDAEGREIALERYRGKVLVIVNTASKCGFTGQYEGLEELYQMYRQEGFEVLGFPCNQFAEQEPGTQDEIVSFCKLNYGVSFPIFEKVDVRGQTAISMFRDLVQEKPFEGFPKEHPKTEGLTSFLQKNFPHYLEGDEIKWNFTKFLIDRKGHVVLRFEPMIEPEALKKYIEKLL